MCLLECPPPLKLFDTKKINILITDENKNLLIYYQVNSF